MPKISNVFAVFFLVGCTSNVTYVPPEPTISSIQSALNQLENKNIPAPPSRNLEQKRVLYSKVIKEVYPAAVSVCLQARERNQSKCSWNFDFLEREKEFNAFASNENSITILEGLIDGIGAEEELAFVVAHEIGHHIADHINEGKKRATKGAIIGSIFGGVAAQVTEDEERQLEIFEQAVSRGVDLGSKVFSIEEELEADLLALEILKLSGIDLDAARNLFARMATEKKRSTRFIDTHPTSPERLAAFEALKREPPRFEFSSEPAQQSGKPGMILASFERVVGSYCIYEYKGKKYPKPLVSDGCPRTNYFKR